MARRPNIRVRVEDDTRGIGLSMAAPSFVNAQDESAVAAAQLAAALGLGQQMAAQVREERREEGFRDASLGQVDEKRVERQRAYREAVEITQAESGWLHTRAAIEERLNRLDLTQIPPDQQAAYIDRLIDEELQRAYGDPTQPQLSKVEAEVIARHAAKFRAEAHQALIEKNRQLVFESTVQEMRDSLVLRMEEGPLTADRLESWYALLRERLGRSRATQETALAILAQVAVETKNPELLEAVPERWSDGAPTFRTDAFLADKYQKALDDARTEYAREEEKQQLQARMDTYVRLYEQAHQGQLDIDEVNRAVTPNEFGNSLITEAQAISLRTMDANARLRKLSEVSYHEYIASGNAFLIGTPEEQRKALDSFVAQFPPEMQTAIAIERGVNNGIMFSAHRNLFNQANPSDPDKFSAAIELYELYNAQQPGFVESQVSDGALKNIYAYRKLRDIGFQHDKAIEFTREADWGLVEHVDQAARREAIETAIAKVSDVPWTWNNLQDNPALNRRVREVFDTYVAMNLPPEQAAEVAIEHLRNTAVYVDGFLYHTNEGWPVREAQDAADAYVRAHIPEGEDPDEWMLARSIEDGYVVLRRRDDYLPHETNRVPIREVSAWWSGEKARVAREAARERHEKLEREYTRKAMDRIYPVRFTGDAAADSILRGQQEQFWNSLTRAQRTAVLEEIAREEEAAGRRRERAREIRESAYMEGQTPASILNR